MLTLLTLLVVPLCGLILSEPAFAQSPPTQEEMQALAPDRQASGGSLPWWSDQRGERAQSGEAKGVGYELGKELARRMGVPYEPLIYQTPKLLVEDVNSGKWDISFVAQDPDREKS